MDQVRHGLRRKHFAYSTENPALVGWITRYILFHDKRHRREMGAEEGAAFLTHLAVEQNGAVERVWKVIALVESESLLCTWRATRGMLGAGLEKAIPVM